MIQKRKERSSNLQPYVLGVKGKKWTFVEADGILFERRNKSEGILAFDLLYELFHVLNLSYPIQLANFFNYIDYRVYKTTTEEQSKVTSMHISIMNFNFKEIEVTSESDEE